MTEVVLTGQLICRNDNELSTVLRLLPDHVAQTRNEKGCISFDVRRIDDSRVWQVDERFVNAEAFAAHQRRVSMSQWGRATSGIERNYTFEQGDTRAS